MDPTPPKRRGRPRKTNPPSSNDVQSKEMKIESVQPKIENLLTMKTKVVTQRRQTRKKPKYKESSSEEEYVNDDDDDEEEEEEEEEEDLEPQKRRSSSVKRKSVAILSKTKTESWGNYRNTIDNGPIPQHALTLNEISFNVALKFQQQNQNQQFMIDYLDQENKIEFINDIKMKEKLLHDTNSIQLKQNTDNSTFTLSPFQSIVHKDNIFTLNLGIGPIQSLDWLSMPTSQCPATHQYLAIGCSRSSLISKHFYDEIYSYENYIQIWMFDLSDLKINQSPKYHQLICFISLNNSGAIWSLKWSPACSYPSSYLAAGTSSGKIYLYKIFSHQSISTNENFTFYKSTKSIQFSLPDPNHQTQCLAIDWSIHDPNRLTACYSNGFIALFHVNTTAKHLSEIKSHQEKLIYPIRLIRISSTPIRDIKFLNNSSNLVLTIANIAKRSCVWDFNDSQQPLIDIENSGTEGVIRSLTSDLLCVKEFTPSYARTSAYLAYEPENNNLPKHIYFQSTPDHVLSVDYSPWLDAILLCDSNGHVYFFRVTNFVRWTRKNECSLKYRLKLFHLNAILKEEISDHDKETIEPILEQSSYSDLIMKYYLDTNLYCDQKFVSKQDDFSKAGSYALNALHRIRFNPNLSSYGWFAFGGESGLLFIYPLQQSWSNYAINIFEKENKISS